MQFNLALFLTIASATVFAQGTDSTLFTVGQNAAVAKNSFETGAVAAGQAISAVPKAAAAGITKKVQALEDEAKAKAQEAVQPFVNARNGLRNARKAFQDGFNSAGNKN